MYIIFIQEIHQMISFMWILIFFILFGAVVFVMLIVGLIGGILFGGKDPYEEELARMDYEDAVSDRFEEGD